MQRQQTNYVPEFDENDNPIYDDKHKWQIIEYLEEGLRHVMEESPPMYRKYVEMMLKLISRPNKAGVWAEIMFIMSNRTGGKTYSICKALMYIVFKYDVMIGLFCNKMKKMGKIANGIFAKVLEDCYPGVKMTEKNCSDVYTEIWIENGEGEKKHIGFVIPLRSDYELKEVSPLLQCIDVMFMDEFQRDSYIPDEVDKFINIHTTIARGESDDGRNYGVRYLPIIMCSNFLSITNSYLATFGVMKNIQSDTKFYRGDGVSVLMFRNNEVAENQKRSAFNRLASGSSVVESNIDNKWLFDNMACVCKPEDWGVGYYICTIVNGEEKFGVVYYPRMSFYYMRYKVDDTCRDIYNIAPGGVVNVPMLRMSPIFSNLRTAYLAGRLMFQALPLKSFTEKLFM